MQTDKNAKFVIVRELTKPDADHSVMIAKFAGAGLADEAISALQEFHHFLKTSFNYPKSHPGRADWKAQKNLVKSLIGQLEVAKVASPSVSKTSGHGYTDEALKDLPQSELRKIYTEEVTGKTACVPGMRPHVIRSPEIPVDNAALGFPKGKRVNGDY